MSRKRILIWHVHGSYLNTLTHIEHEWILPVRPGRSNGYGGRGETFDMAPWVREVPANRIRDLELDLVIYQSPENLLLDGPDLLGSRYFDLPSIYLEHNTPKPSAVESVHTAVGSNALLIHVTHFNELMWDNGDLSTKVIEHSTALDDSIRYEGTRAAGILVANNLDRRGRSTGFDVFLATRSEVPLDVMGMGSERFGGLGDIPYRQLHNSMSEYRFMFSPMRYTSLPLSVVEAMMIGMPVVALGTTAMPSVIENGVTGFVSCDLQQLTRDMHRLLESHEYAEEIGENGRQAARQRFDFGRFTREWNAAFDDVTRKQYAANSPPNKGRATP